MITTTQPTRETISFLAVKSLAMASSHGTELLCYLVSATNEAVTSLSCF